MTEQERGNFQMQPSTEARRQKTEGKDFFLKKNPVLSFCNLAFGEENSYAYYEQFCSASTTASTYREQTLRRNQKRNHEIFSNLFELFHWFNNGIC